MSRLSRDEVFMGMAFLAGERGTCLRAQVGAVIVQRGRPISIGYNGSPPGKPHCLDVGCEDNVAHVDWGRGEHQNCPTTIKLEGCGRCIHAEANAIAWAARMGVATNFGEMFSTYSPCKQCAELILSAGIQRLVFANNYRAERLDILKGEIEVAQLYRR